MKPKTTKMTYPGISGQCIYIQFIQNTTIVADKMTIYLRFLSFMSKVSKAPQAADYHHGYYKCFIYSQPIKTSTIDLTFLVLVCHRISLCDVQLERSMVCF